MAVSGTKGSMSDSRPTAGVGLAPDCRIYTITVTAPVDAGPVTGFNVSVPGMQANDKIMGAACRSIAAANCGVPAFLTTAGNLQIVLAATALSGSEKWDVTVMTQA